MKWSLPGGY
uniref:Uncharacterized protein n=1 Tax=Arundo donax TaxID=35708 RepID=A0A0A9H225_ARUDO